MNISNTNKAEPRNKRGIDNQIHETAEFTVTKQSEQPIVLAIETSCDETAISILHGFKTLSHQIHSQADMHAEFGGVFPNLAKREHAKNFIPLLIMALNEAFALKISLLNEEIVQNQNKEKNSEIFNEEKIKKIREVLSRENELVEIFIKFLSSISEEDFIEIKEKLHAIAVTYGPGLEPALWVGISAAKALAIAFDLPLYPINHMEGHIASVLASDLNEDNETPQKIHSQNSKSNSQSNTKQNKKSAKTKPEIEFPAIALLVSGGHTELVHIDSWHSYKILGQTVDDAVGEAYDKTARLLGLPYPGGPHISKLASLYRAENLQKMSQKKLDDKNNSEEKIFNFPRPMLYSKDFNFSFSGLKTAVLYSVRDRLKELEKSNLKNSHQDLHELNITELPENEKMALAGEFEEAVIEVLTIKTKRAIEETGAQTLIIGGGVIANTYIRDSFTKLCQKLEIQLMIPEISLSTDNARMIGLVAILQIIDLKNGLMPDSQEFVKLKAEGNLGF